VDCGNGHIDEISIQDVIGIPFCLDDVRKGNNNNKLYMTSVFPYNIDNANILKIYNHDHII